MPQDVFREHIQNASVTNPGKLRTYLIFIFSKSFKKSAQKCLVNFFWCKSLLECLMKILAVSFLLSLRLLSGENCSGSPVAL